MSVFNYYDVNLSEIEINHKTTKKYNEFYGLVLVEGIHYDVKIIFDCFILKNKVLLELIFYKDASKIEIKTKKTFRYSNLDSLQKAINSIKNFKPIKV